MSEGHAENLLKDINVKAAELAESEKAAEHGYVALGLMLLESAEMGYWRVKYDTFGDYLKTVAQIARRTPGQLRQYFLTVRDLSGAFNSDELGRMGITKALRLRSAKDYALVLPQAVITAALDSTVSAKELKKIIGTELKMPEDPGDWMDLEAEFMVSPEQRATIEEAIKVAMHTEPLTKMTISKSQQMLDVVLKWAMEFLGSHAGDGL